MCQILLARLRDIAWFYAFSQVFCSAFVFVSLSGMLHAQNLTQIPPSISLLPGIDRQDKTISTAGNGEQTFFTTQGFSISGAPNATYTLSANDSTTHFEASRIQLQDEAKVALLGYHTLSFGKASALVVGSGSFFSAILSDKPIINPQASEYGGESKVRFGEGATLILSQNAQANFTQLRLFIHDGEISLQQGSKLTIEAQKAIRFQDRLYNHEGAITLHGNVYNVGAMRGDIPNDYTTTAHFISENGTITIDGDFHNGGDTQNAVDTSGASGGFNAFDPAFGGGGDLTLYGGSMTITGALISQRGGEPMAGGEWRNPKDSSINLYGSVLDVKGGVQNLAGSTIRIGAYEGKFGAIKGDVANSGVIIIDPTGAAFGKHIFLQGTLSGNGSIAVLPQSGSQEFLSFDLVDSSTALEITPNTSAIDTFRAGLSHEEGLMIGALDSMLTSAQKGTIYGYGGSRELTSLAQDSLHTLQSENITTPIATLESIQSTHTTATPLTPQILARLTNALPHYALATTPYRKSRGYPTPRGYAPYQNSPFTAPSYAYTKRFGLDVRAIGGGSFGKYGAGGFGGAEIGGSVRASRHTLRLGFSFLASTLAQSLTSSATKSSNQAFGLSLSDTIAWGGLELDMGLLGSLGLFEAQHSLKLAETNADSRANFLAQRLMGELAVGWRIYMKSMFIKPYVGMRHYLFWQDSITQSGTLVSTTLQGYQDYMANVNLGVQGGFAFAPRARQIGIITARLDYEPHLYNTKRQALLELGSTSIPLTLPYDDKLSLGVQGQYQFARNTISAEIFYTRAFAGLHALGVNAGFSYQF